MLGFLANEGYELFPVNNALTEAELEGFLAYVVVIEPMNLLGSTTPRT